MSKRTRFVIVGLLVAVLLIAAGYYLRHVNIAVLDPKGEIGIKERGLIVFATLLSLVVVVPVFALTGYIAWQYRAGNTKAKYSPDWDHNRLIEGIWWLIPTTLIVVLSIVTWNSSHQLDPYRAISSSVKPLTIQVVALQWKWLFIYPEQRIASVNLVQFPVDTPVNFIVTADAPMNSFWIPQLGGQIYAMPGMTTQLHLVADQAGSYRGLSANISGEGFAGMVFTAKAGSQADFNAWVNDARRTTSRLDQAAYAALAAPSSYARVALYSSIDPNLYDGIAMKYLFPAGQPGVVRHPGGQSVTPAGQGAYPL